MNPASQKDPELILDGARYRQSHKASVIGILGSNAPEVYSQGSQFFNHDRWTLRVFIKSMCDWAKGNPGCVPTSDVIHSWVLYSNNHIVQRSERAIVIAATPDKLPIRTACALTGGGYHEAFHTYYSCRRDLRTEEMSQIVLPRWASLKDWSKYFKALLDWSNVIEDIRIERCGQIEFEGTYVPLCDLQDFILNMEASSDTVVGKPINLMSGIIRGFRDIGLGYNTDILQSSLIRYKKDCPQALDMLRQGPLADILQETIRLKPSDDTACLRVAMDILVVLGELNAEGEEDSKSRDGQPGDGEQKCPKCGASAGKLRVRPLSDGSGHKVPGKGVVTCTVCGFQQEVSIEMKPADKNSGSSSKEQPQFEGFDEEDLNQKQKGSGQEGGSKKEDSEKGSGSKKKKDKPGKDNPGDGSGDGESGGEEDSDSDDSGKGSSSGDDSGEDGSDSGSGKGSGNGGEEDSDSGDDESGPESNPGAGETQSEQQGGGAGGFQPAPEVHPGNDWTTVAAEALADMAISMLDNNSALSGAVAEVVKQTEKDIRKGEAPWKPFCPSNDECKLVRPSIKGQSYDLAQSEKLLGEVKSEIAFLRARLRNIVRAMEMTNVVHGVPKGKGLSSRFLVDSKITIAAGEVPQKAYYKKGLQMDMSMACAVVVDESGSMSSSLRDVTKITLTLTEPFDSIDCPTMVVGFRDGDRCPMMRPAGDYHRYYSVYIDVFKMWHERFNSVKWRFANTRAAGSTPMSDGIQYAMKALEKRPEARKFLFVVTDGDPNSDHYPVVRHQIRIAREAGIDIIGVGMGDGAYSVTQLFDDYVWVPSRKNGVSGGIQALPRILIAKLNELADRHAGLRRNKKIHG